MVLNLPPVANPFSTNASWKSVPPTGTITLTMADMLGTTQALSAAGVLTVYLAVGGTCSGIVQYFVTTNGTQLAATQSTTFAPRMQLTSFTIADTELRVQTSASSARYSWSFTGAYVP